MSLPPACAASVPEGRRRAPSLLGPAPDLRGWRKRTAVGVAAGLLLTVFGSAGRAGEKEAAAVARMVQGYCVDCHDDATSRADISFEGRELSQPASDPELWESVVRKLEHRQMPPPGEPRPDESAYGEVVAFIASSLDRAAEARPDPGRTESLRRLTRTEYQNAIRDLLAVEIDAAALLPQDEPSFGFDNVAVGNLSPTLVDRYVSAAQKIARLAIGGGAAEPAGETYRVRPDVTQEDHLDGLPIGTRGGTLIRHIFPQDGIYELRVRLARDRNEQVEGLRRPHELEVLLDRERVGLFTIEPPGGERTAEMVDAHLRLRFKVTAGPHDVGVTFPKGPLALAETERQPFLVRFNVHRHPRTAPAVYQVTIDGPFEAGGPGDTPSRRLILGEQAGVSPKQDPEARARAVLTPILRRAYRRPVTEEDLHGPMQFFRAGFQGSGGFDGGIESALTAILVSPRFLLRIESDPPGLAPGTVYRISDLELASRLSFFLWSSLPDDALLEAAVRGDLRKPAGLEKQVRRMLADERAGSLVTNFASQWLHLRALESATPDLRLYIDFDDNLRQALRRETELLVETVFREDRSVTELLSADYTFLNERLAKHYRVPNIYGSHFRRVSFADDPSRQRGGLLRQGSILTVTSYATRTSPVLRGKWILDNILGTPPPPPPPDVPSLDDTVVAANLPMRERLAEHRRNPTCARCHDVIDPVGFALENFDAIGRWRDLEDFRPIDSSGGLADGSTFDGVGGLEEALLRRPELFASTVAEKLLVFALGRGVTASDGPALRAIVRRAAREDYRFSALILGVVNSTPFQMRRTP